MNVFKEHPFPWTYNPNYAFNNSGDILEAIIDADQKMVLSNHFSENGVVSCDMLSAIWQMYFALTNKQEKGLMEKE